MSIDLDADLALMLKDVAGGVVVVYNGASSYGILDRADGLQATDGAMMQVRTTTLRIATRAFSNLRTGASVIVAGDPFRISEFNVDADGRETVLSLVETS